MADPFKSFYISGVWKGWRRQPALCRVSRWQSLKPFLGFWNNCLLKNEDLKVAELAADNPRLLHAKKLLYTVSRYSEIILLKYQFWYRISYLFILPSIQIDSGLESEGRPSEGLCGEPTEGRCQSVWLLWKWWTGGWSGPRWHYILLLDCLNFCFRCRPSSLPTTFGAWLLQERIPVGASLQCSPPSEILSLGNFSKMELNHWLKRKRL